MLKETLENRGVLGQIRARIRAEVFSALDDQVCILSDLVCSVQLSMFGKILFQIHGYL